MPDSIDQNHGEEVNQHDLSEEQKRQNFIRQVFGGDEQLFERFRETLRAGIPPGTGAVVRGSGVTGQRWKDGATFDSEGAGTSDIDLTLIGGDALKLFRPLEGFYIPGLHSRPVSERAPDIAPDLVPLREELMALVGRPVNIQATADFMMFLRGDLLGQPYLTLIARPDET